ncbi:MAG: TlpA family protein disulfide reductase [Chitinophagaceae bacterium]|nr:MAG: TlpA family protein disulfide reductase [Chitinophagaceae bacterium]
MYSQVREAQARIKNISYEIVRTDTFTTGSTRRSGGHATLKQIASDSVLGFAYYGKRDSINQETIYDGKMAVSIAHDEKLYDATSDKSMIPHYYGSPGGQMIVPELIKLDTSGATKLNLQQDAEYYYLWIYLADVKEEEVANRYKIIKISKTSMLPVQVRSHLEAVGKNQDLNTVISSVKLNNANSFDFSINHVPEDYKPLVRAGNKTLESLKGKVFPSFALSSFNSKKISNTDFKNKVVLIDFWEVWCSPCLASMPKVDSLYLKYRDKGFDVLGLMSEKEQLEVGKSLVKKKNIMFPMALSDETLIKKLNIRAVPTYILLNRKGEVVFISEGFSKEIEKQIFSLL